jgi:hydrogenase maturation protease
MAILVLGIGNALMNDDALGVIAIAQLQERYHFPAGVSVVDGGTLGLDLLPLLEGVRKLLIIDAIDMSAAPGELFRLEGEDVPRAFASKLSVHQMGVQDLLAVAELQGHVPEELVVWGIQPGSIEMEMRLTPAVAGAMDPLLDGVVAELANWGVELNNCTELGPEIMPERIPHRSGLLDEKTSGFPQQTGMGRESGAIGNHDTPLPRSELATQNLLQNKPDRW